MTLLSILIFSFAYCVKGAGWLYKIPYFGDFYEGLSPTIKKILSFKLASAIIVFIYSAIVIDLYSAMFVVVAWLLAVSLPIRDECLSVGRIGFWSGVFKDAGYSRSTSVVKAVQRGAWMGAVFTVIGFPSLSIVIMALGFPLAHFIAQELYYRIHKTDSWTYAEPVVGALIGLCFSLGV